MQDTRVCMGTTLASSPSCTVISGVGTGGARGATGPPNISAGGAWPPPNNQDTVYIISTEDIQPKQIHDNEEISCLQLVKVYIHVDT